MRRLSRFEGAAVILAVTGFVLRLVSYYWYGIALGNPYIISGILCFGAGLALLTYYYSSELLSRSKESSRAKGEVSASVTERVLEAVRPGRS